MLNINRLNTSIKRQRLVECWWLMPIILAIQETEIRRTEV
jgi:hypothetical protein